MNALSVKLPHDLHASLASEARRRNVTRSALVRDILADALARDADVQVPSCAELAGDLVGAFRSGRNDLATNKAWSKDHSGAVSGDLTLAMGLVIVNS